MQQGIGATREIDGKTTTASRYYILSKPLSPARFLDVVRADWHVENRLHRVLDVTMDEDLSRARKDNGAENLARLRCFALDIIRANQDKASTSGKIERAARDDAFLLQLLAAAYCDCLGLPRWQSMIRSDRADDGPVHRPVAAGAVAMGSGGAQSVARVIGVALAEPAGRSRPRRTARPTTDPSPTSTAVSVRALSRRSPSSR